MKIYMELRCKDEVSNMEDCVMSRGDHAMQISRHIVMHAPCPFSWFGR